MKGLSVDTTAGFDVEFIRKDFPLLARTMRGHPIAYLDNAATSQKPQIVIDTLTDYYSRINSNIHRGVYQLSQEATDAYEQARATVQHFLGANRPEEIIFTRGATEAINLIASSYGKAKLQKDDEIILSHMEHHSNIVPWQILAQETGAILRVIPIDETGELDLESFYGYISKKTKLVALVHVSNSLGTINPVKEITEKSHEFGVPVLLDGAQAVPHIPVNVKELDCDFYTFSGHKVFGPTGIGALYGKYHFLEAMPPYQGGGDMIRSVTFEKTTYNDVPAKFEAGTPHISGAIGLEAALNYVRELGYEQIETWEKELLVYGTEKLQQIQGLKMIGSAKNKVCVFSFIMEGIHPHDVGQMLDFEGIAVRTGHHCTQPVMDRFNVPATTRASLAFYNTKDEIDRLTDALSGVSRLFK